MAGAFPGSGSPARSGAKISKPGQYCFSRLYYNIRTVYPLHYEITTYIECRLVLNVEYNCNKLKIQSLPNNDTLGVRYMLVYMYTNLPKVFVQTQISFHIF